MTVKKRPSLKRHRSLQPLSREHHFSLLLCWKIRKGLEKGVEIPRMEKYLKTVWDKQIAEHFQIEEDYVFPVLPDDHPGVQKAIREHKTLKRLFSTKKYSIKTLNRIEETMEAHIRFEERELFPEAQKVATEEEWERLEEAHDSPIAEVQWDDEFWV